MLEKPQQRKPRGDVEVGVAIPIGCLVPLAIAAVVSSSRSLGQRAGSRATSSSS